MKVSGGLQNTRSSHNKILRKVHCSITFTVGGWIQIFLSRHVQEAVLHTKNCMMYSIENHDKKPSYIFINYFHFSAITQFISSYIHLLPSPCFLSTPSLSSSVLVPTPTFSPLIYTPFILFWHSRKDNGVGGIKRWKQEVKRRSDWKGASEANGERSTMCEGRN